MKSKIKLSELLEKLYSGDYLTDEEFEIYLKLVDDLKKKEKNEITTSRN
jgi:hypothetical protein